jgi:hypothetical protein
MDHENSALMKTFRLTLSIGGPVLIEAERYEIRDGMVYIYRDGAIVAEYAEVTVKEIGESNVPTHKIGLFESWSTSKEGAARTAE